jgi:FdrA protein
MVVESRTINDTYQDSVKLMRIASEVMEPFDLEEAFAMMGTDANKEQLSGLMDPEDLTDIGPNDLVLVAQASDPDAVSEALDEMQTQLRSQDSGSGADSGGVEQPPKSISRAVTRLEGANMALISVPGEYAAREAWKALEEDLHVHLFSDNVDIEDEYALKTYGRENDRLVMGPDCGTAIINGVPLGFANEVRDGPIGIVSASGTGLQEVSSLVHRTGSGVSQAIGTGGRDLKNDIGGIAMRQGLEALVEDDDTEVIVLISKPPESETMERLLDDIRDCPKPVVVNFIGSPADPIESAGGIPSRTLEDTARAAIHSLPATERPDEVTFEQDLDVFTHSDAATEILEAHGTIEPGRQFIRGLYSGGTLCSESLLLLQDQIDDLHSNLSLGAPMDDPFAPEGHAIVDLGEDELTQGRPHPMIDPTLRNDQLREALQDDEVLVVLLDVVLGHGSHPDPAEGIVEVMEGTAASSSDWPIVVASVCGTEGDPQSWESQIRALDEAGVYLAPSNADAVEIARSIQTAAADGGDNQ